MSKLENAIVVIVTTAIGLAVGLGVITNEIGQIVVTAAGPLVGAVILVIESFNGKTAAEDRLAHAVQAQTAEIARAATARPDRLAAASARTTGP